MRGAHDPFSAACSALLERGPSPRPTEALRSVSRADLTAGPRRLSGPLSSIRALLSTIGAVSFENKIDENGDRLIWLERRWLDRLTSYRRAGESYSDVILRVVVEG